jgi:phospholipid-binding lipoprotein MlaA
MYLPRITLLAVVLLLPACAALPPGQRDARDPFERVNRSMYRFNVAADRAVFRPVARAWRATVPPPVRLGLDNFAINLAYPTTIVNDVLQGKFTDGAHDLTRLLVNTVFGLGFFDPATAAGLQRNQEDFGQTLGKWGVHSGPYLMLPLFGPSTVRDAPAKLVDDLSDVRHYLNDPYARWGLWVINKTQLRAKLLDSDQVLERTYDPYAFVRSAWLQLRDYAVRDGNVDASESDLPADEEAPPPDQP